MGFWAGFGIGAGSMFVFILLSGLLFLGLAAAEGDRGG